MEDYDQTALVRSLISVFPVWKCLKIPFVNFVFTNIVKKKKDEHFNYIARFCYITYACSQSCFFVKK